MRLKLLFLFLVFNLTAKAGDYRGGDIHIQQYTASSVQVNININLIIHSEIEEIVICWGDGSCETLSGPQVSAFPEIDTKTLHFFWVHQYNDYGFYEVTVEACCWANDIVNMALPTEEPFALAANFKLLNPEDEEFNVMPYSNALPVGAGIVQQFFAYGSNVDIPQGDETTFELCAVDVSNYLFLSQIFTQPANNFLFDPLTGGLTWFSPNASGHYIMKVCITTTRGGQMISETSRDVLIAINNPVRLENVSDESVFNLKMYPNPAQDFLHFDYDLKTNSRVEIEFFDAFGRKVETLLSEAKTSGNHHESFNIRALAQGVYFCKMKTKNGNTVIPFVKQ